jgi:hypothetical protein
MKKEDLSAKWWIISDDNGVPPRTLQIALDLRRALLPGMYQHAFILYSQLIYAC